jgi:hypothetical protein
MGVVSLCKYDGDIMLALRKYKNPFDNEFQHGTTWHYCDNLRIGLASIHLQVDFDIKEDKRENILVSSSSTPYAVNGKQLTGSIDELLKITGITEMPSDRRQFKEFFSGWADMSRYLPLISMRVR